MSLLVVVLLSWTLPLLFTVALALLPGIVPVFLRAVTTAKSPVPIMLSPLNDAPLPPLVF